MSGAIPRKSIVDAVGGVFRSPLNEWQATNFPQVGSGDIVQTLDLPLTIDSSEAQRLAWIGLQKAGERVTVAFPATLDAIWLYPWEVVTLTLPQFGWSRKEFRIIEKSVTGFGVDLSLREETASYDMPISDYQAMSYPPTIIPPESPTPAQVTNLTGYLVLGDVPVSTLTETTIEGEGDSAEGLSATSISESEGGSLSASLEWDSIESSGRVEYQRVIAEGIGSWREIGTSIGTSATISGLAFGTTYRFRVRAIYTASGAAGDWSNVLILNEDDIQ